MTCRLVLAGARQLVSLRRSPSTSGGQGRRESSTYHTHTLMQHTLSHTGNTGSAAVSYPSFNQSQGACSRARTRSIPLPLHGNAYQHQHRGCHGAKSLMLAAPSVGGTSLATQECTHRPPRFAACPLGGGRRTARAGTAARAGGCAQAPRRLPPPIAACPRAHSCVHGPEDGGNSSAVIRGETRTGKLSLVFPAEVLDVKAYLFRSLARRSFTLWSFSSLGGLDPKL